MKLILAVIHDHDKEDLLSKLVENGFQATKLASTGGFLREGNCTLMIGVEKEKVDEVLIIIEEVCKRRERFLPYHMHADGGNGFSIAYSEPIVVGGAVIFVMDIDKYKKV